MMIRGLRGHRRIWIAASTALLTLAAIVVPWPSDTAAAAQARRIDVNAWTFAFEPATIQVQRGNTVTLHLESLDAEHGLFIDGYDVNIQAEPGKSAEITFVADQEGKFKFRCSVTCGALHPFMIGEMTVDPDFPFARAIAATIIASIGAIAFFWRNTV